MLLLQVLLGACNTRSEINMSTDLCFVFAQDVVLAVITIKHDNFRALLSLTHIKFTLKTANSSIRSVT